jgi:hypothetical protein
MPSCYRNRPRREDILRGRVFLSNEIVNSRTDRFTSSNRLRHPRTCGCAALLMKTSTAQHRRAKRGLKRNSCGRSTFETNRVSLVACPYVRTSLGLTCLAAFRVVLEFFLEKEELLSSRENELRCALNALQNSVREFHWPLSAASEISRAAFN